MEIETLIDNESPWQLVSDSIMLNIFFSLNSCELVRAGLVCKSWLRISQDEFLWRNLLRKEWKIKNNVELPPGKNSWRAEFIRLKFYSPVCESEVLKEHTNEVLHVAFSHDGNNFATCSKDGFVKVWNANYPASVECSRDMKEFSWKYTQFSQFNECDTLLLVSGVHFGLNSTSGEIAVFNLDDEFKLQCRVRNKPYDIFGTWYNENYLLSGDLKWLGHLISSTILWLNRASQEVDSEYRSVINPLYRFYNKNGSSIRTVMVANCLMMEEPLSKLSVDQRNENTEHFFDLYNHKEKAQYFCSCDKNETKDDSSSVTKKAASSLEEFPSCYQTVKSKVVPTADISVLKGESEDDEEEEECVLDHRDKYLIFTTGSKTYTPHEIGFKRIRPFRFKESIMMSLKEKLAEHNERLNSPSEPPDWPNEESVQNKFDKADHYIDLHGHIIGMALSPDHRYLYVNSRPWPQGYRIENPFQPPPIAQEIDIHVIDMVTLKEVGTMLGSHKAYTPNDECFFIFLDVSPSYVASGAEDKHGYLWDRHYGICITKYPHSDVVNSVAFNPCNSEMLVTASDDYTIKIWRSKRLSRNLQIEKS